MLRFHGSMQNTTESNSEKESVLTVSDSLNSDLVIEESVPKVSSSKEEEMVAKYSSNSKVDEEKEIMANSSNSEEREEETVVPEQQMPLEMVDEGKVVQQSPIVPKKTEDKSIVRDLPQPSDLPDGWVGEARERLDGRFRGRVDRYYYHKETGIMARSRKEIKRFEETGSIKKQKPKKMEPINKTPLASYEIESCKSEKTPNKNEFKLDFDHLHQPEKVLWVLCDTDKNIWDPMVDGKAVPEYVKETWRKEFDRRCAEASDSMGNTKKKRKYTRREKGTCSIGSNSSPHPSLD